LRTLLGCFLFGGDDVEKKIKVLSGGEKARVALAKTIISKANFLMLDEPTNHLDMHSCDLLIESLNKYEGSYILVSHDRYFVSKTANKIWEIVDHQVKEFDGGYEEWVAWKSRMALAEKSKESRVGSQESKKKEEVIEKKEEVKKPVVTSIDKEAKKELQKQQKIFQQLEEKIAELNKKKVQLESALSDPGTYSDKNKFLQAETDYKKAADELKRLNVEYERVFEKIMKLEE
jgi:ATP-binding cassette subfamily F protein 3